MSAYVLDTNTVSYLFRGHPAIIRRLTQEPSESVCISTITEGELRFGIARKPEATHLRRSIEAFLLDVKILAWDSEAAKHYAGLRAALEKVGKGVGALDLLIVAHAISIKGILVTSDKALQNLPDLTVEDWAALDQTGLTPPAPPSSAPA